jgi:hypothetical protein
VKKKSAKAVSAKPVAIETPLPLKKTDVKITPAKGRPMLTWVGKRPLSQITAFPAQHIETYDPTNSLSQHPTNPDQWKDWPSHYPKGGLLFHGDNKEVLAHLLANGFRGKVNLIYIDPPFDSGADYVRKVSLRGPKGTAKFAGELHAWGADSVPGYLGEGQLPSIFVRAVASFERVTSRGRSNSRSL